MDTDGTRNELPPTRILVYGVTGSGKSTLARLISERTGLPFHDVDSLTWNPGWEQKPVQVQREIFSRICDDDEWVLDTAYGVWLDVPLARVQLIVALDYPRWVSLWRLVRRTLARVRDRQPVCNGNVETWRQTFSRDSIIAWHFRSFKNKRRRIRAFQELPGVKVIVLRSPAETDRWLASLDG